MLNRTAIVYRYDGTLDGMLCCIYEAMTRREEPMMIVGPDEMQSMLYPDHAVGTDKAVARRVADAVRGKISEDAMTLIGRSLLTALPGRESYVLGVIRRAFKEGPGLLSDLSDQAVNRLTKAVLQLEHEAHLYTGFIRFQQGEGVLTAAIEPKNQVLPLLLAHFEDRFASETYMIFDKTHKAALVHAAATANHPGESRILPVEAFERPAADENELAFQRMWRAFYRVIAVEGRENPTCRRSHMPGRYWAEMTEFQGAGPEIPAPRIFHAEGLLG